MIRLVFKITPGCAIDKLYKKYEGTTLKVKEAVKSWMSAHGVKEWACDGNAGHPVSVIHPRFDRELHQWDDDGDWTPRPDFAPPHPALIVLKKNSFYEYSPNRKTKEGRELAKLWRSWSIDMSDYDKMRELIIGGQGEGFFGVTARCGTTIYSVSTHRVKGTLFAIVPRNEPFKAAEGMTEVLASEVLS